jgi:hypothetical protein
LLPNPAAPQTDAADEFVEVFNPTGQTVDLTGYILLTGNSYNYKYAIKNVTLAPHSYHAFYSRDTKLVLSNSGGRAKIDAPDGSVVDETDAYTVAADGQAWIFANSKWQWTSTPTPGRANIFTVPAAKATTTKKPKTAVAKKTKAKKTKRASAASSNDGTSSSTGSIANAPSRSVHPMLLAGVGALAVAYAGYEYRQDLANQLHRLRRHREARRAAGQIVKAP